MFGWVKKLFDKQADHISLKSPEPKEESDFWATYNNSKPDSVDEGMCAPCDTEAGNYSDAVADTYLFTDEDSLPTFYADPVTDPIKPKRARKSSPKKSVKKSAKKSTTKRKK